jgi:hypothetical protein
MAQPELVTNPRSDRAFQELAESLVRDGATTTADLATELRGRYPRVVVRDRDLSDEHLVVWYIYREGRWVPNETA